MAKKISCSISCFFFFSLTISLCAQHNVKNQEIPIPLDPAACYGKLTNGFTYYIRRNTDPAKMVYMYLVVKAGKNHEDTDQVELSHLTEHMAFLGSKNLPPAASYFEKEAGLQFGNQVSARTSDEYTSYYITLPDTDDKELIDYGLRSLREWAREITFDPGKVDNERNVVIEEIRWRGQSPNFQYIKQLDPQKPDIDQKIDNLRTFRHESLLRFYRDWYRPDLQAAIIVGDIDVEKIKSKIEWLFNDLKMSENPKERGDRKADLDGKNRFMIIRSNETNKIELTIHSKRKPNKELTASDYRRILINEIYNQLIKSRLANIKSSEKRDLGTHAVFNNGTLVTGPEVIYTSVLSEDTEMLKYDLQAISREIERVAKFGFSVFEFEDAKNQIIMKLEKDKTDCTSSILVNKYLDHFTEGTAAPSPTHEYQLKKSIMAGILMDDIKLVAKNWFGETDRDIIIMAPEHIRIPNESTILKWIVDIRSSKLDSFNSNLVPKLQLDTSRFTSHSAPPSYKVTTFEQLGVTQLTLSNGTKIILKPFRPKSSSPNYNVNLNKIELNYAISGGTNQFSDKLFWTAKYAPRIIQKCGVGSFPESKLYRFMTENDIFVYPYIEEESRGIKGVANNGNIEAMFQMANLYMTSPNKDQHAFNRWLQEMRQRLTKGKSSIQVYLDSTTAISNNFYFRKLPPAPCDIDSINFDAAFGIYNKYFTDQSNATLVITGDFSVEQAIPLALKYFGNLGFHKVMLQPSFVDKLNLDYKKHQPVNHVKKIIRIGNADKARIDFIYYAAIENPSDHEYVKLVMLKTIVNNLLMDRLRNKEGKVYIVRSSLSQIPSTRIRLGIYFDCNPLHVEELLGAATDEISNLRKNGPSMAMLQSGKHLLNQSEFNLDTFIKWQPYLSAQYLNEWDPSAIIRYSDILADVTIDDLKQAAKYYLRTENLHQFTLLPKVKE